MFDELVKRIRVSTSMNLVLEIIGYEIVKSFSFRDSA